MKINKGTLRVASYILIVGGLAATGLIFYGKAQYTKAQCDSSSYIRKLAQSEVDKAKSPDSEDSEALKQEKLNYWTPILNDFNRIDEENSKKYKAFSIVGYSITTAALIAFGLCLKHADYCKSKEDE